MNKTTWKRLMEKIKRKQKLSEIELKKIEKQLIKDSQTINEYTLYDVREKSKKVEEAESRLVDFNIAKLKARGEL